jgi:hypothetical protein
MPDRSTDDLVHRYQAGESCAPIAAATGLRLTTAHGRLKRAGIKLRPPGRPASPGTLGVTDVDLVARYRAGEICAAIAAATGLSRTTVGGRLRRAGVEMRRGGKAPGYGRLDLPVAEIIERYRAGESTVGIGRSLGVSAQAIRERLIEAGIARRGPGPLPGSRRRKSRGAGRQIA